MPQQRAVSTPGPRRPGQNQTADGAALGRRRNAASDNQERQRPECQRNTPEIIRQASRKAVFQGIQRNRLNFYHPEPNIQPSGLAQALTGAPRIAVKLARNGGRAAANAASP